MGVSKNRDTPKLMVLFDGKPYFLMDDSGGKHTIFGNTHMFPSRIVWSWISSGWRFGPRGRRCVLHWRVQTQGWTGWSRMSPSKTSKFGFLFYVVRYNLKHLKWWMSSKMCIACYILPGICCTSISKTTYSFETTPTNRTLKVLTLLNWPDKPTFPETTDFSCHPSLLWLTWKKGIAWKMTNFS